MKSQTQQDPFGIQEVIEIINGSAIPESRKLVYLYSIANGSFNQDHLEDLSTDLRAAGMALEAEKMAREEQVKKMQQELQQIHEQMDAAAVREALNYEKEVKAVVRDIAQEVEQEKKQHEQEQAKTLRKKLK